MASISHNITFVGTLQLHRRDIPIEDKNVVERTVFFSMFLGVVGKQASASFVCVSYKELWPLQRFAPLNCRTYPWSNNR